MKSLRFLITAGPTREPIDPVRFLSNRSSGRMAHAVAGAALERGHEVVLVSGPVAAEAPPGVVKVDVETAAEMQDAVTSRFDDIDCLVMAAAVADYRPAEILQEKMKKEEGEILLRLERNPDILAGLAPRKAGQTMVGFALETEALLERAQAKLEAKKLDLIVANDTSAFAAAVSTAHFVTAQGPIATFENEKKLNIARALIAWIEKERQIGG